MTNSKYMSDENIEQYETLKPLVKSMYEEFQNLSKKKPEETLSKMKVSIVNVLLMKTRELLKKEGEMFFLYLLDDESLPRYSDTVIILSQYVAALNNFKNKYYYYSEIGHGHKWHTERNFEN